MTWERARSDEQKEIRIQEILTATARLFKKKNYEDISFALIAKEAKFTRSNLYKYFTTKEEVFLALQMHDITLWGNGIAEAFDKEKIYTIEEFSSLWKEEINKHQRMLKLFGLSATLLEKNVSDEMLIQYKKTIFTIADDVTELLKKILPDLPQEKILDFITLQLALASGLYPMSHALTDKQKKVIRKAGIEYEEREFSEFFGQSIEIILRGMK